MANKTTFWSFLKNNYIENATMHKEDWEKRIFAKIS